MISECGLDSSGSGWIPVVYSCDKGYYPNDGGRTFISGSYAVTSEDIMVVTFTIVRAPGLTRYSTFWLHKGRGICWLVEVWGCVVDCKNVKSHIWRYIPGVGYRVRKNAFLEVVSARLWRKFSIRTLTAGQKLLKFDMKGLANLHVIAPIFQKAQLTSKNTVGNHECSVMENSLSNSVNLTNVPNIAHRSHILEIAQSAHSHHIGTVSGKR
jgi:hypothetical protein